MKIIARLVLLIFSLVLTSTSSANEEMQTCIDMEETSPPDQVLECYKKIAYKKDRKKHPITFLSRHNRGLEYEWSPVDTPFMVYKQNYLLVYSKTSQPNYDPVTPDINPHIPIYNYQIDNRDVKFQISFKAHLMGVGNHTLWAGYSQLSFWQFYDHQHSTPFRETNYEPELIYSHRPENQQLGAGIYARFLNAGLSHQSDGQSLPGSRGWNRLYIQAGLERNLGEGTSLEFLPRIWKKLPRGTQDISDYLGYGDIELRYRSGQSAIIAIAKMRSVQFDLAFPLSRILGEQVFDTNLHLQYFNGYGESLIDYNQSHHTMGIGVSLPFE